MMPRTIRLVSTAAYHAGMWQAFHRFAHRDSLTVVMFHHVMPAQTGRNGTSGTWTVSTAIFDECIRFFKKHYRIVSLMDVLDAVTQHSALPDRALLITFDDGWENNATHALPILRKHGVPAVVFAVAGWIGEAAPWNEVAMQAWEYGDLTADLCSRWWALTGGDPTAAPASWRHAAAIHALLVRVGDLAEGQRRRLIAMIPNPERFSRQRPATAAQLELLRSEGVAIAPHGMTHLPIALTADASSELRQSRLQLAATMRTTPGCVPAAMSFPHGSYDERVVKFAREEGYQVLFTSDACVNRCERGQPSRLLGRITITEEAIADASGNFLPERMASWLFRRPRRKLNDCGVDDSGVRTEEHVRSAD